LLIKFRIFRVFGSEIVRIAEKEERVVALTAAMPHGTGLIKFSKRFPERFFDVGIAEQHAVTFGAGLAKNGMIPVIGSLFVFSPESL